MSRLGLSIAAAAAVSILASVGVARADKVETRAWPHAEFGRLVFEWPRAVDFTAVAEGDRLVITFARPIETSLAEVAGALKNRLTEFSVGEAGRTVTARMTGPASVRSFVSGTKVIVDVVPSAPNASADPPAMTDSGSGTATRLPVRVGEHPGFGRLVFDWRSNVDYRVAKSGDKVTIRFDRPATVDVAKLSKDLPGQVLSVDEDASGRGLALDLAVVGDARVRHFRDGTRVVVDILGKAGTKRGGGSSGSVATGAPRNLTVPTPPRPPTFILPDVDKPSAQNSRGGASPDGPRRLVVSAKPPKKPSKVAPDGYVVSVDVDREGPALTLQFNWREPVSAAVFRRDGVVWALFGRPSRMDLGGMRVVGRGIIEKAAQLRLEGATLIKLDVPSSISAELRREADTWIMSLQPRRPVSLAKEGIVPKPVNGPPHGPHVLLSGPTPERIFRFRDPVVGDEVIAVPLAEPENGVPMPRKFVDFELLRSAQGIAILPVSETLDVRADEAGVLVTSPRGLMISRDKDLKAQRRTAEERRPLSHIREWSYGPERERHAIEARLIEAVVKAPKAKKNDARLRLARFYVRYGEGAAAYGVLSVAQQEDPAIVRDLDFRAARGAANFLISHYGEAHEDLTFSYLKDDRSAAPWLGAIAAVKGDWKEAERLFRDADWVLGTYPSELANRFRAMATEASLVADDLKTATTRLAVLERSFGAETIADEIDYLKAHLQKRNGNPRAALTTWDRLAASKSRALRAKAKFSAIETRLDQKEITPEEAIDRLEGLSFAWRGGFFEFDLLRRLGRLYAETGDLRKALHSYRRAATYFEDAQGVEAITSEMTRLFRDLFLDGRADELSPIRALALYQEFRELTPVGKDGDEMIRKLADRLVKVDLLGEAAELLRHQVEHRLAGVEKARIGARLAVIELLRRAPGDALKALDLSEAEDLPYALADERRYLAAQAKSEDGDVTGALALLDGLRTAKADAMRVEIYWRNKRWNDAARVLGAITVGVEIDGVNETEAENVLRYAVALALDGDSDGLSELRSRLGQDMKGTEQAAAFDAIVGKSTSDFTDFKTLAQQAGGLDSFQAFMASYRERMKSSDLSAIN
jgi:hypothetical protein